MKTTPSKTHLKIEEKVLLFSFFEVSITLISKPDRHQNKGKKTKKTKKPNRPKPLTTTDMQKSSKNSSGLEGGKDGGRVGDAIPTNPAN